jgi:hypothetical protein
VFTCGKAASDGVHLGPRIQNVVSCLLLNNPLFVVYMFAAFITVIQLRQGKGRHGSLSSQVTGQG